MLSWLCGFVLQQCMTYVRSMYGTKDDAHMKAESLMPSKILGATAAGADVDEVRHSC